MCACVLPLLIKVCLRQGMFDVHLEFTNDIYRVIEDGIFNTFKFNVVVESIDSYIVFYSLIVAAFSMLHFTFRDKISDDMGEFNTSKITPKQLETDLLLFDFMFWFLLFLLYYIMLDVCMPVCNTFFIVCCSFIYTAFLFQACSVADIGKLSRGVSLAVWVAHAALISSLTNLSIFNGSCIMFFHFICMVFFYINAIEETLTQTKFVNIRLWVVVLHNICFVFIYVNNAKQMVDSTLAHQW